MRNKLIIAGGGLLIILALFHLSFWSLFNWQEELPKLSAENTLAIFFLIRTIAEFIFPGSSIELGVFLAICTLVFLIPATVKKI